MGGDRVRFSGGFREKHPAVADRAPRHDHAGLRIAAADRPEHERARHQREWIVGGLLEFGVDGEGAAARLVDRGHAGHPRFPALGVVRVAFDLDRIADSDEAARGGGQLEGDLDRSQVDDPRHPPPRRDALADLDVDRRDHAADRALDRAAGEVLLGEPLRGTLALGDRPQRRAARLEAVDRLLVLQHGAIHREQGLLRAIDFAVDGGAFGDRLPGALELETRQLDIALRQFEPIAGGGLLDVELGRAGVELGEHLLGDLRLTAEVPRVDRGEDLACRDQTALVRACGDRLDDADHLGGHVGGAYGVGGAEAAEASLNLDRRRGDDDETRASLLRRSRHRNLPRGGEPAERRDRRRDRAEPDRRSDENTDDGAGAGRHADDDQSKKRVRGPRATMRRSPCEGWGKDRTGGRVSSSGSAGLREVAPAVSPLSRDTVRRCAPKTRPPTPTRAAPRRRR